MGDKKLTDIMLERIKYFINAIDNGEYKPKGYEFTVTLHEEPHSPYEKVLKINDSYTIENQ